MKYYALVDPDNPNDAESGIGVDGHVGFLYADPVTAEEHRQHLPDPDSCAVYEMTAQETAEWAARICRDNPKVEEFIVYAGDLQRSMSLLMLQVEAAQDKLDPPT